MTWRSALAAATLLLTGCAGPASSGDGYVSGSPGSSAGSGSSSAATSSQSGSSAASSAPGDGAYLALGDSLTAGVRLGKGERPDEAFPALVRSRLESQGVALSLTNLGCAGEDVGTFTDGGRCVYPAGSQLDQAIQAAREASVRLVTVDLGVNDVLPCLLGPGGKPDKQCLASGIKDVAAGLTSGLARIREATGPKATIAVLTYYDPFVARGAGLGAADVAAARAGLDDLNATLRKAAAPSGALVVDIAAAFHSADAARGPGEVCALTYLCDQRDVHLTDAGNQRYADAVLAVVRPRLAS